MLTQIYVTIGVTRPQWINSLELEIELENICVHGGGGFNFGCVIIKQISAIDILYLTYEIIHRCLLKILSEEKSNNFVIFSKATWRRPLGGASGSVSTGATAAGTTRTAGQTGPGHRSVSGHRLVPGHRSVLGHRSLPGHKSVHVPSQWPVTGLGYLTAISELRKWVSDEVVDSMTPWRCRCNPKLVMSSITYPF